jgi:hypothetical protein
MTTYSLPLFPLNTVLFPQGVLPLRIFEARYLDMVRGCLRHKTQFVIVAVTDENTVKNDGMPFADIGTACSIMDVDVTEIGLMNIRCIGEKKVRIKTATQQVDGLWIAELEDIALEPLMAIPEDLTLAQEYLQQLIDSLIKQDIEETYMPLSKPFLMDDCGWVANRWSEILSMPLIQKQRMLALDSPLIRLELVQDLLNSEFTKH